MAAMIFGMDGMPVEQYTVQLPVDIEVLNAESSDLVKRISDVTESLGLGQMVEFTIVSDKYNILMRKITPEYYVAMIVSAGGNFGKGRFMLRSMISKIKDEF